VATVVAAAEATLEKSERLNLACSSFGVIVSANANSGGFLASLKYNETP
jgi:hypothetical protein